MIRTVVILLYLVIFFIIGLPLWLVERIMRKSSPDRSIRFSYSYISWGFRCIHALSGVKLTVIGRERVPADTPVLYISNHRSFFDVILLFPLMNNPTSIMAKKEMEKIPFLSYWMKLIRCQFIDRNDIKQGLKCILACIKNIKDGVSVCIFPEGTRSPGDEMNEFRDGSFKVAQKTGCLIVPVAVSNTENVLEQHFPRIKAQPVVIEFGEPVDMKTLDEENRKHIGEYVQEMIAQMLVKNHDLCENKNQ